MFAPQCSTGISAQEDLIQFAHLSHTQPHVYVPIFNRHFCRRRFNSGCPSIVQAMFAPQCSTGISAQEDLIQFAHLLYKQPHVCAPIFNRHFCRGKFSSGCPSVAKATTCLHPHTQPAFPPREI